MSKDTSGSAFPTNTANADTPGACYPDSGMTLRDYFAAGAAQGLATAAAPDGTWFHGDPSDVAKRAFEIADAMLIERAK